MVQKESIELLENITIQNTSAITQNEIQSLPEIVQLWLQNSGVIGNERVASVRLKQNGIMLTKPHSKWMSFKAAQYFKAENTSFIWNTNVDAMLIIKW